MYANCCRRQHRVSVVRCRQLCAGLSGVEYLTFGRCVRRCFGSVGGSHDRQRGQPAVVSESDDRVDGHYAGLHLVSSVADLRRSSNVFRRRRWLDVQPGRGRGVRLDETASGRPVRRHGPSRTLVGRRTRPGDRGTGQCRFSGMVEVGTG